ncbi:MAG TPA: hypothetical protein VKS20_02455 [Candidatus Acidoferrales bacterium]|nr:hypothetical protein [Candidatus Acidoferrales bacterium]
MANCTKCGAAVAEDSGFCGACGQPRTQASAVAPATASVAAAPMAVGGPVPGATASGTVSAPGLTMNLAAALSYALGAITGVLFLVLAPYKDNRFVRFHAIQSIILNVAIVAVAIVWSIIVSILVSIAGFWVLTVALPLDWLFGLGIFALWLFMMFQAYSEREFRIPWIGDIAAKQVH